MPYEPTIWQTGDVITAEKLNKIEQALYELSGGGGDEPPAGYVTVAPKQSVTVVDDMVAITLADGVSIDFTNPASWPVADYFAGNCIVKLNDTEATYNIANGTYSTIEDTTMLACFPEDDALYFYAGDAETDDPVPGTYTVAIYAPEGK